MNPGWMNSACRIFNCIDPKDQTDRKKNEYIRIQLGQPHSIQVKYQPTIAANKD